MKVKANTQLAQARMAACRKWPFATSAILSLIPVESPGLGTCAVDQFWRLYYDPEFLKQHKPEVVAGIVCHEVSHLLLKHATRAKTLVPAERGPLFIWNIACDCAINEQLKSENIPLPEGACYPEVFGLEKGHPAEYYYRQLMEQVEEAASAIAKIIEKSIEGGEEGEGGDGACVPGQSGSCSDGRQRKWEAPPPEDEDETQPETNEQPQEGNGQGSGPEGNGTGSEPGGDGDPKGQGQGQGAGQNQSQEKPPPGIPEHEADQLRRDVAEKFQKGRGTQRGNSMFGKWSEDFLNPKVDPRVLLMRAVRHSLQQTSGGCDEWTYRRPSRRQSIGGLLRPAPVTVIPRVVVLIDTSGSMGHRDLSLAVGLVAKVLSGLRLRDGIQVYAGDTGIHCATKCFNPRDVVLAGGGGTDVGAMLEEVYEKAEQKPDVMLAVTDGWTPWPNKPLPCRVVACLTQQEGRASYPVPGWIHSVVLNP